ncbi:MAG: hypothetical protein L3J13_01790 [Devosiaceae bacterium]|nr:hypothetical protein [Devosiaceae bacterium]
MSFLKIKATKAKPVLKSASLPVGEGRADGKEIIEALLGPVLTDSSEFFQSRGVIERSEARAVWTWLERDSDKNLNAEAFAAIAQGATWQEKSRLSIKIANLIAAGISAAQQNPDVARRIQIQLGEQEVFDHLAHIEVAFRHQQLLSKSVAFGQAINGVRDENSLKLALQTFPVDDPAVSALMMHAAIGQVQNPNRLINVVLDLSDGSSQRAITASGYASVVEGLIAHAQDQLSNFTATQTRFADMDLTCRSLGRYHRLIRAVTSITETDKSSQWATAVSMLIRHMSELIEPRLMKIDADIRQSLRKTRSGPDRLDSDLLLDALNGLYLLAAVREALDSLALNSLVKSLWNDIGKALEVLISRNLDAFRNDPENDILAQRLNTGIKMAEIRFNPEYADIMARARDGASKRAAG